jgi:hypothetical protein
VQVNCKGASCDAEGNGSQDGKPQECRSVREQCVRGGRIGLWQKKKSTGVGEPEVVTIPNVQDLCGLSPINLVRLSNALSDRAADQYAAILFLHDSRAGHDVVAGD